MAYMTIFDLSHSISTGMPVYPGDPRVAIHPALSIETDGTNVAHLRLGTHTGTHLDAPSHTVAGGRTVDQLELELLHVPACILALREEPLAVQSIDIQDIESLPNKLPTIVCIAMGWDQYFHTPQRERHPFISLDLAEALWQRGARVLGVDTLSPDPTSSTSHEFPVHDFWLGNDGVVVENLRNLTVLPGRVHMSILPLRLTGLDGSPVRAIASIIQE